MTTRNLIYELLAQDNLSPVFDKAALAVANLGQASVSALGAVAQGIIALPAAYEQSEIGFTAMMNGDKAAADTLLTQLQNLANVTPFTFQGQQQAARELEAMGQTAQNILPELHDIDTAVAAVGGTGAQVDTVTAALAKMDAEGKTSAIFLNELTRDGIPAWQMLSEAMGVPVDQLRKMSSAGQIAASTFDQAFHDYTIKHWGDALQAESQTFGGLLTTASDLGQQFERTFGAPIIAELEPKLRGAISALEDPQVVATLKEWGQEAADFAGWIFDAAGAMLQMLGLPAPDLSKSVADASQFAGSWASTDTSIADAAAQTANLDSQIQDAQGHTATLRDQQATMDALYAQQTTTIRNQQAVYDAGAERHLLALRDQVAALQEAWALEDKRAALADAQSKLGTDTALAGDIFSSAGQAARDRLKADRTTVAKDAQDIQRDTLKNTLSDQQRALETQKQIEDQGFAAHTRTLEAERQADDQAMQAQTRAWERHIRDLEAMKKEATTPPTTPVLISPQLDQQAIDEVRGQFRTAAQAAHDGTDVTGADPPASGLFTRVFGTPAQQQDAGKHLLDNLVFGMGQDAASFDWGKWWDDALGKNAITFFGDLGSRAAKAFREGVLGLDKAGVAGAGANSDTSRFATTPANYTANPFDPSSWNPVDAISKAVGSVIAKFGPGATTPDRGVNAAVPGVPHRAAGGPVDSGWYVVGERGPELLHAGGGGQVYPSGRGSAPPAINITVNGFVGSEMALAQQLSEILGAQFQGRNW